MTMRVVVTGGAGFIGSTFVSSLLQKSGNSLDELVVIDNLTYAGNLRNLGESADDRRFSFQRGDITNRDFVASVIQESDYVINFAAESHVDNSIKSSDIFIRTNILGTHNLLEICMKKKISRFLQVSTDEVYGSIEHGSWKEDFPLSPNSPYAGSKASADLLVRTFNVTHGLNTTITRCSNNYGPKQFTEKLIPVVIKSILQNKEIPVYGTGTNVRDWLHVDDHCVGLEKALFNGRSGEIYNIGGGTELSNISLVYKIIDIMGKGKELVSFVTDRKGHDRRYSVDYTKIKEELGYSPSVDFISGMTETIEWYVNNIDSWWDHPHSMKHVKK